MFPAVKWWLMVHSFMELKLFDTMFLSCFLYCIFKLVNNVCVMLLQEWQHQLSAMDGGLLSLRWNDHAHTFFSMLSSARKKVSDVNSCLNFRLLDKYR